MLCTHLKQASITPTGRQHSTRRALCLDRVRQHSSWRQSWCAKAALLYQAQGQLGPLGTPAGLTWSREIPQMVRRVSSPLLSSHEYESELGGLFCFSSTDGWQKDNWEVGGMFTLDFHFENLILISSFILGCHFFFQRRTQEEKLSFLKSLWKGNGRSSNSSGRTTNARMTMIKGLQKNGGREYQLKDSCKSVLSENLFTRL